MGYFFPTQDLATVEEIVREPQFSAVTIIVNDNRFKCLMMNSEIESVVPLHGTTVKLIDLGLLAWFFMPLLEIMNVINLDPTYYSIPTKQEVVVE